MELMSNFFHYIHENTTSEMKEVTKLIPNTNGYFLFLIVRSLSKEDNYINIS